MIQGAPAAAAVGPDQLGRGRLRPAPPPPNLTDYGWAAGASSAGGPLSADATAGVEAEVAGADGIRAVTPCTPRQRSAAGVRLCAARWISNLSMPAVRTSVRSGRAPQGVTRQRWRRSRRGTQGLGQAQAGDDVDRDSRRWVGRVPSLPERRDALVR